MSKRRILKRLPERVRDKVESDVLYLAERGFHARTIAKIVGFGLTAGSVYYITGRGGLSLRDYRDGKTQPAKKILAVVKGRVKKIKRTG